MPEPLDAVTKEIVEVGPGIFKQALPRVRGDLELGTVEALAVYLKEVINKTRNIFGPFTQGRDVQ